MAERIDDKHGPLEAWGDDVPLRGEGAPKNNGQVKHLIEYLLTVYKRFGNTAVTADLQWGASALHKRDDQKERIAELERELAEAKDTIAQLASAAAVERGAVILGYPTVAPVSSITPLTEAVDELIDECITAGYNEFPRSYAGVQDARAKVLSSAASATGENADTKRLEWLFHERDTDAIMRKVRKVEDSFMRDPSRGTWQDAIDAAMRRADDTGAKDG